MKKAEQKLTLVKEDTKEETPQQLRNLDSDEIRRALSKIVDRLDQVLTECALQFHINLSEVCGTWSTGPWLNDSVEMLNPWAKEMGQCVSNVLRGVDESGVGSDSFFKLRLKEQEAAYLIGVLVGARLAGYSRERINQMVEYLACNSTMTRSWYSSETK